MLFESLKKRSPSQITINIIQIFFNFDLFLLLTHVFHTWHNGVIKSQWSIKLHLQKLETLQNLKTVAITSCKSICLLIPPFGHRSYVICKLPSLLNLELMTSQRHYHFNKLIVLRQIRIFLLKSILLLLLNFLFAHNKLRLFKWPWQNEVILRPQFKTFLYKFWKFYSILVLNSSPSQKKNCIPG